MKLFVKAVCVAFVLTVLYSMIPFQAACSDISEDVFRLHILANSDSEDDQALKLRVRDRVLAYTADLFDNAASKEEAEQAAAAHLQEIADVAAAEAAPYQVKAELTHMYFDTRYYDSFTLPSGSYDALRLTIGEGEGHNWWCVMFPSLCISSEAESDRKAKETLDGSEYDVVKNEKQEYKFFIVEFFEKIRSAFS